jgi:hypothetical protein
MSQKAVSSSDSPTTSSIKVISPPLASILDSEKFSAAKLSSCLKFGTLLGNKDLEPLFPLTSKALQESFLLMTSLIENLSTIYQTGLSKYKSTQFKMPLNYLLALNNHLN